MRDGYFLSKHAKIWLIFVVISFLQFGCSSQPKYINKAPGGASAYKITKIAQQQIGIPYRYGGTNPKTGFDCSGLVNYSYKKAGILVPRTTRQLYKASNPVKREQLKRGDMVFFKINRRSISHVGLYLGNGRFVHAPSSGKKVNISNMNDRYWRYRFVRGGRI